MITIRAMKNEDRPALLSLHAGDYKFPENIDLAALADVDGTIRAAALLRRTTEAYFLLDDGYSTRRERLGLLLALHQEIIPAGMKAGYIDTHAWLSPREQKFGDLLMHLGWKKPLWPCYHYEGKRG